MIYCEKHPEGCFALAVFLSDVQESYDGGTQNDVGQKLKYEVESNENYDQISTHRHVSACGTGINGVHKEGEATEKKDSRVDYGADDCRYADRKITIFLFKKLVNKTREKTRKDSLDHNGNDGAGDAETHPEGGICRHKEDDTGNAAEPRARKRAAQGRAQNHGDKGERDGGKTADLNKSAHVGEKRNKRGK